MPETDAPAGGYRHQTARPARSPAPIETLDKLCAASIIAHETVYEFHRRLVLAEKTSRECADLLAESARITTKEIPAAIIDARKLASRWSDEVLIDPEAAQDTLAELSAAMESLQPRLRALLQRQKAIAETLRSRLATGALD
jgi:hypothetical protein